MQVGCYCVCLSTTFVVRITRSDAIGNADRSHGISQTACLLSVQQEKCVTPHWAGWFCSANSFRGCVSIATFCWFCVRALMSCCVTIVAIISPQGRIMCAGAVVNTWNGQTGNSSVLYWLTERVFHDSDYDWLLLRCAAVFQRSRVTQSPGYNLYFMWDMMEMNIRTEVSVMWCRISEEAATSTFSVELLHSEEPMHEIARSIFQEEFDVTYTLRTEGTGLSKRARAHRPRSLVVRVPAYGSRGAGFDSQRYQIFWKAVSLELGPFSNVRITEELLEWNSAMRYTVPKGSFNWCHRESNPEDSALQPLIIIIIIIIIIIL
jgi:hypothetical protein